jgi:glucose 1-dehydrogenase
MQRQGGGGKIILIGSIMGEMTQKDCSAYCVAKSALPALTKCMANELAEHQINVNLIQPGYTDTPGERRFSTEEEIAANGPRLPLGRLGKGSDIAGTAAFLASDMAGYISGTTITVDGAYLTRMTLDAPGMVQAMDDGASA